MEIKEKLAKLLRSTGFVLVAMSAFLLASTLMMWILERGVMTFLGALFIVMVISVYWLSD